MGRKKAFTLIELLVVIAIIAILAGILFPVLASAKESAKKAVWTTHVKQTGLALVMYANDHDDDMVLSNSGGIELEGWGYGRPDHVWPELIQPYIKNWQTFRCPLDPDATDFGLTRDYYEEPVSSNHPEKTYFWGERSNIGLNYEFLSPWVYYYDLDGYTGSESVSMSEIGTTAETIMTMDSIWHRDTETGRPFGGGNWVVEPPCIFDSDGKLLIPVSDVNYYQGYQGWQTNPSGQPPYSWLEFGGAWPFFKKKFTVSFCDGHMSTLSIGRVTEGCDVQDYWGGAAYDGDRYLYDLR